MVHSKQLLKKQQEVHALTNSSRHVKSKKKIVILNVFSAKRLFNLTILLSFLNIVDFTRLTTKKDVKEVNAFIHVFEELYSRHVKSKKNSNR